MNREIMRAVAGANLVAGCLLLQGCGLFGQKSDQPVTQVPGGDLPPVDVMPVETLPTVESQQPIVLPVVGNNTTPYTIQKGDTISSVSYKYGLRWQDVVAVNPGISPNRLRVGQVVQLPGNVDLGNVRRVPAVTPRTTPPSVSAPATQKASAVTSGSTTTYVVKAGDSLSVIAQKHGTKVAELRTLNNLKGDKIFAGQKLKVPGATKAATDTAAAAKPQAPVAPKITAPKTSADAPKAVATEAKPKEAAVTAPTPPPPPASPVVETAPVKAEAAPVDPNVQTYTVKDGEDLYAVAIRWGVSPSDLKALNNLTGSDLKAGTQLKIPSGN